EASPSANATTDGADASGPGTIGGFEASGVRVSVAARRASELDGSAAPGAAVLDAAPRVARADPLVGTPAASGPDDAGGRVSRLGSPSAASRAAASASPARAATDAAPTAATGGGVPVVVASA